jgi:hypothetical protein
MTGWKGEADDTYLFAPGDGQDTSTMNGVDVLRFAPGIRRNSCSCSAGTGLSGTDTLEITFRDSNDSLTLRDYFISNHAIEQIVFADGTVWDESAVKAMLLAGTEAAQSLQAFRRGVRSTPEAGMTC